MNHLEEISLEGFQVVKSDMFAPFKGAHVPSCTLWYNRIHFSKECLTVLNNCENVLLKIHPAKKHLIIVPVSSSDPDGIRWVKKDDPQTLRSMESKVFGGMLYDSWKLDKKKIYKMRGTLVTANKKVMLFFDFTSADERMNTNADCKL